MQMHAELEWREKESQERGRNQVIFLPEEQVFRPYQEQPFD